MQVEGDTVTFSFEMRSGREHNTPDKAMWGFLCTVRAQVSTSQSVSVFRKRMATGTVMSNIELSCNSCDACFC